MIRYRIALVQVVSPYSTGYDKVPMAWQGIGSLQDYFLRHGMFMLYRCSLGTGDET